jgi:hypothetical protein
MDVVIIITAQNCSACKAMRGETGELLLDNDTGHPMIPGGDRWNSKFFRLLLTGGKDDNTQRFRVFEYHFPSMSTTSYDNIDSLSEFKLFFNPSMKKMYVEKDTYVPLRDKVEEKKSINGEYKESHYIKMRYEDFLKTKVPSVNFGQFVNEFPNFMFVEGTVFDDSLKDKNIFQPLMLPSQKTTVDGRVQIRRDSVVGTANKIVNGQIQFSSSASAASPIVSTIPVEKEKKEKRGESLPVVDICSEKFQMRALYR